MLELLLQIKPEVTISLMHGSIYALDRTWFYYQIKQKVINLMNTNSELSLTVSTYKYTLPILTSIPSLGDSLANALHIYF